MFVERPVEVLLLQFFTSVLLEIVLHVLKTALEDEFVIFLGPFQRIGRGQLP